MNTLNTASRRSVLPANSKLLCTVLLALPLLLPGMLNADASDSGKSKVITTNKGKPAEAMPPASDEHHPGMRPHWRYPAAPWHRLHPNWRERWYRDAWQEPYLRELYRQPGMDQAHREIERARRHMDWMMRQSFRDFDHRRPPGFGPREQRRDISIKVSTEPDHYQVVIQVPGGSADNIEVRLDGRQLSISGKQVRTHSERDANGRAVFESESMSQFSQSTSLPGPVKPGSMRTEVDGERMIIRIAKAGR